MKLHWIFKVLLPVCAASLLGWGAWATIGVATSVKTPELEQHEQKDNEQFKELMQEIQRQRESIEEKLDDIQRRL